MAGVVLTGATWSTATVWPDERIKTLVTAASTGTSDGRFRIGDLTVPAQLP